MKANQRRFIEEDGRNGIASMRMLVVWARIQDRQGRLDEYLTAVRS